MRILDVHTLPKSEDLPPDPEYETTIPEYQSDGDQRRIVSRFGRLFYQDENGKLEHIPGSKATKQSEQTTIKAPPLPKSQPKPSKNQSPLEANITQSELAQKFAGGFNFAAWLVKSEATYEAREFSETSRNILELVNLFPALRIVLRLLGPAFSALDIWKAVKELLDGRRQARQPNLATIPTSEPKQPFAQ